MWDFLNDWLHLRHVALVDGSVDAFVASVVAAVDAKCDLQTEADLSDHIARETVL